MAAADLLNLVTRVTVETAWTPPIVIDKPFEQGGAPSPVLKLMRPRITVELANGAMDPVVIEPYGSPEPSRWPLVRALLLTAAAVGIGALARKMVRRPRLKR